MFLPHRRRQKTGWGYDQRFVDREETTKARLDSIGLLASRAWLIEVADRRLHIWESGHKKSARCGVNVSTSRPASSALTPCTALDGTMKLLPA